MTDRPVLEKCKMTPQEVFEYKRRWLEHSYQVDVHSDLDVQCKAWCRGNLNRWEWSMDAYTDVYSHSFYFENDLHGKEFARKFAQWVDKGKR